MQNLRRLQHAHPGFDPDAVFQARLSIPPRFRSPDEVSRFYERLADRLTSAPGVEQVGVISVAPLSGLLATVPFSIAGEPVDQRERLSANLRAISPAYPLTVGTRLLQGRLFLESDRPDTPPVALVSAALAERLLSGRAVGRQLLIDDNNQGPRPIEIVGVVENVRHTALDLPPALDIYIALRQVHPDGVAMIRNNQFWMVRTASDPAAFRATFLAHLRAIDPDVAISDTGPMRQFVDDWFGPRRFNLGLFGAFAATAVLLAVLGLYGLASYAVGQRVPEIGVRMAIGATRQDVQWMILRQAVRLSLAGVAIGLGLAAGLPPLITRAIPSAALAADDGAWLDPAVAAATTGLLMGIVLVAAWLPARRAALIDPTRALRAQ
jgi:predicted permease